MTDTRRSIVSSHDETQIDASGPRLPSLLDSIQGLLDRLGQGVLVHRGARPLYANQVLADLHGLARDEILGKDSVLELVDSDCRDEVGARWLDPDPSAPPIEYDALAKDGSKVRMSASCAPVTWLGGPAVQVVCVAANDRRRVEQSLSRATSELEAEIEHRTEQVSRIRDELKREKAQVAALQDELRLNASRLRGFAECAADWFWEVDAQGRISYLSERYEAVTGTPIDQVLGTTRREHFVSWGIDPDAYAEHFADLEARRQFTDFEYERILADGRVRVIRLNGRPVFDENGAFQGYRGTGTDVTELATAEHEAREAQSLLVNAIESLSEGVRALRCRRPARPEQPGLARGAQSGGERHHRARDKLRVDPA